MPPFFKDVHASFKFCALVFGGERSAPSRRPTAPSSCTTRATVSDPDRCFPLAPSDFARVNPNTGTAPVFRTRRDADITRGIYERHPVLVDRSGGKMSGVRGPVGHFSQGHVSYDLDDSHLFQDGGISLSLEGFYPVQGCPLEEGRG